MHRRKMKNKTTWKSAKDVTRNWYEVDATGVSLGRLASHVARLLMGKNSADYVPNLDMGHNVIILNIQKVAFTGKKKAYMDIRHYTGYPGGLKIESVNELMTKNPKKVIETAIRGMLPKTRLQDTYMSRLHLYIEGTHAHEAQKPVKITVA